MSTALAGLIFLQAYWISHDVELKQKQFDQSVKEALIDVIDKVEQYENLRIVAGNFLSETDTSWVEQEWLDTTINSLIDQYVPEPPLPPPPMPEVSDEVHARLGGYLERIEERRNPDLVDIHPLFPGDSTINIKIEKDFQQKEVISLQMKRYNNRDSITEITEQRVKSKLRKLNNMMQRFTFQVIDPEQDPLKRIKVKELDSIIYKELVERGLPMSYNFGIKRGGTDTVFADGRRSRRFAFDDS